MKKVIRNNPVTFNTKKNGVIKVPQSKDPIIDVLDTSRAMLRSSLEVISMMNDKILSIRYEVKNAQIKDPKVRSEVYYDQIDELYDAIEKIHQKNKNLEKTIEMYEDGTMS